MLTRRFAPYPAATDAPPPRPPVARTPEGVVLPLGGEVQRELHAVEPLDGLVGQDLEAQAVGGDARLDPALPQRVQDGAVVGVEAVLPYAEIHRPDHLG